MTIVVVAEKPSAAKSMQSALLGSPSKKSGTYNGQSVIVAHARGHLYEFIDPAEMVEPDKQSFYKGWNLENLPWNPEDLNWAQRPIKGASDTISTLRADLKGATEIVCATDNDPTGEGDAIFWNAIIAFKAHQGSVKISRMYFTDEAIPSLKKAFEERETLSNTPLENPAFRKAALRAKFDLLTMPFTRVASLVSGQRAVIREGRLKSPMVRIVGEGLDAYNNYKKVPRYKAHFIDDKGVAYNAPDAQEFKTADEAQAHIATLNLKSSTVTKDKVERKKSAPGKLLDLAGLSGILSSKGYGAKEVLDTYQKMYEALIVSYPRTEDKVITQEQYNEMLPHIDAIADVVGADKSLLTKRGNPRKIHIGNGSHGANRPGLKVPASIDAIRSTYGELGVSIYTTLARSFLVIFAEDYEYDAHTGHVTDFPDYVGTVSVPAKMGYKGIFSDEDDVVDTEGEGLGQEAQPEVKEVINPRPPHPTQKWLMKQLDKNNVGTGATRTSTFAEVSNAQTKYPLLKVDKKGKVTMAPYGEMSYRLLPGTRIGAIETTEYLFDKMKEVAEGSISIDDALSPIGDWVVEDRETMKRNAVIMKDAMGLKDQVVEKEYAEGDYQGVAKKFNRLFCGHRFSDAEVASLFAGESVAVEKLVSPKTGKEFGAHIKLESGVFKGRPTFGPKIQSFIGSERNEADYAQGTFKGKDVSFKKVIRGYTFTDDEVQKLLAGKKVTVAFTSAAGKPYEMEASLGEQSYEGRKYFGVGLEFPFPSSIAGHTITDGERRKLLDGGLVEADDFISKAKKPFSAKLKYNASTKKVEFVFDNKKKGGKR